MARIVDFGTPVIDELRLLGSIFPETIVFDGKSYRIKSYDKMLDIIYQEAKQLRGDKKKKSPKNEGDFSCVPKAGASPSVIIVGCDWPRNLLIHRILDSSAVGYNNPRKR